MVAGIRLLGFAYRSLRPVGIPGLACTHLPLSRRLDPVLEALACGTPVMTAQRTSLPEVGASFPLYVDGTDIDEMAGCLHALERGDLTAQVARCRMEGPTWARRFSWRRCAERTVEAYLRAAAAAPP